MYAFSLTISNKDVISIRGINDNKVAIGINGILISIVNIKMMVNVHRKYSLFCVNLINQKVFIYTFQIITT